MSELFSVRERAKRTGPSLPAELVRRTRLDGAYARSTGRIVRLSAPGGYGKSTLVARWVADDPRAVVWLLLEPIDNDPLVLMGELARGLTGISELDFEGSFWRRDEQRRLDQVVVPTFAELIRSCSTPFVVVLDDLHVIDDVDSSEVIATLGANLPPGSTLVLAGRGYTHEGALARMRLHPGVVDLGVDDLAFDLAETEEFLRLMGVSLDFDSLERLAQQFEGWPAGLRLAQVAAEPESWTGDRGISRLGRVRFVTDYLEHEWLGRLDPDDELLLMEVACLDRFTAAMCHDVLGRSGCGDRMRELRARLPFLLPLDQHAEWYRLHQLLASLLSERLRDRDVDRFREIHSAASTWWERQGDVDLAIQHAATGGDLDRCEQLIVEHFGVYLTAGHNALVRRWLDYLPEERVTAAPGLQVVMATTLGQAGVGTKALRWTQRLHESLETAGDSRHVTRTRARCDAVRATLDPCPPGELIGGVEQAFQHLRGGEVALAYWALGTCRFRLGDLVGSRTALERGAFEAQLAHAHVLEANLLASASFVADVQGDRAISEDLLDGAEALVRVNRTGHIPSTLVVASMSALTAARRGRRDGALASIALARRHVGGYVGISPFVNIACRLPVAQTLLLLGDPDQARHELDMCERYVAMGERPERLQRCLDDLRRQIDTVTGLGAAHTSALTEAERRVMTYLPTNLSLADISTRLYVSRNTVKSHTAAIYRKLGVTSRTDAVERARALGMIGNHASVPD